MRWLFLIVLSLNLAYIGWEMSRPSAQSYDDVPPLKNVQPIVLLSELKADEPPVEVKEKPAAIQAGAENNEVLESAGREKEPARQDDLLVAAKNVQDGAKQGLPAAAAVKPVVIDKQVTEEKAVSAGKPVVPEAEKSVPVAASSPAENCFTMGPFRDLGKLRGLTRDIKSYVVSADFRGREEKEQSLYWVYIKPEKSRKKAIQTGERLKAKKIKDFYVIRSGEKKNGLSLGHFKNKDGAYGLAKKVRKLGFNVIVEPVFKTYTIYWLDYKLATGANIPESIFRKYASSSSRDKVSRMSRQCAG